jgi:hypothetical protein
MSKDTHFHQGLDRASEITISIKARKSGRDIPRPVWFVHEGNNLYLLPVQGSDTKWYKNLLANQMFKISVNGGMETSAIGRPLIDRNRVDDIINKFKHKYGEANIKKYYTKFDVAVEVAL